MTRDVIQDCEDKKKDFFWHRDVIQDCEDKKNDFFWHIEHFS